MSLDPIGMDHLEFADVLKSYCILMGASVTSWGRTEKHNRAVGGVANSRHLEWLAADVVYDAPLPLEKRQALARQAGLTLIVEGDHDHLMVPR